MKFFYFKDFKNNIEKIFLSNLFFINRRSENLLKILALKNIKNLFFPLFIITKQIQKFLKNYFFIRFKSQTFIKIFFINHEYLKYFIHFYPNVYIILMLKFY